MEEAVVANRSFDEKLIANIHSLVEAGKSIIPYRDNQNAIYDSETGAKIYLPPEAKDVPEMMQDFLPMGAKCRKFADTISSGNCALPVCNDTPLL